MEFLRVLTVGILVSWVPSMVGGEVMASHLGHIPAIYNFGDSNSDTGGIAAAFYPMAAPCGETFFGKPAGRGCDGRLIIDFIAEHMKLPYLSAYLNSIGTNFRHGANFATGGATIRRQNESWFLNGASPFSLDIQTEQFHQFKERTTDLYNQAKKRSKRSNLPRPKDFSKALYTFDIGQNDIAACFRNNMSDEQMRVAIPDIVDKFAAAVKFLYTEGARVFWVHNTGPIGCLPVAIVGVRNPKPGYLDEQGCVKGQNDIAMDFNRLLKDKMIQLRTKLPEAAITYVDIYAAKYGLISNAKNQGFDEAFKICCGIHENDISIWCGNKGLRNGTEVFGGSCAKPSTSISWDGVHYSEAANRWVANQILKGWLSNPHVTNTQAFHKHRDLL
ncbi:GDSL esterase/lipase At5g14450-like [Cornus florida]|uniref:GDSL esterase/lipase At5g14450-like n=1 Tax=Cornus florida TaxID=4283 RepID=UPI00289DD620|nr:GDSL esterase/lipase At5g14450-like [Cornus florida]